MLNRSSVYAFELFKQSYLLGEYIVMMKEKPSQLELYRFSSNVLRPFLSS